MLQKVYRTEDSIRVHFFNGNFSQNARVTLLENGLYEITFFSSHTTFWFLANGKQVKAKGCPEEMEHPICELCDPQPRKENHFQKKAERGIVVTYLEKPLSIKTLRTMTRHS